MFKSLKENLGVLFDCGSNIYFIIFTTGINITVHLTVSRSTGSASKDLFYIHSLWKVKFEDQRLLLTKGHIASDFLYFIRLQRFYKEN